MSDSDEDFPPCATCGHPMYCTVDGFCVNIVDGIAHHDGCKADPDDPESSLRMMLLRGELTRDEYIQEIDWLRRVDADIERILSLSEAEIDAELSSRGVDPHEVTERAHRSIDAAIAAAKQRRGD